MASVKAAPPDRTNEARGDHQNLDKKMSGFMRTWSGMVNAWECDELGHLNMRFYLSKAAEARQMFIMRMGLPGHFHAGADSTVQPRSIHVRYQKEARPGAQLYIETGIIRLGETQMQILHKMYHASGQLAALLIETLDHIFRPTGAAFNWPQRTIRAARAHILAPSNVPAPKGLGVTGESQDISIGHLKEAGYSPVGSGVFQPDDVDIFGQVTPSTFIGRLSDCAAVFNEGWPEYKDVYSAECPVLGVMLELRLTLHTQALSGDPFQLYSGVVGARRKIRRLTHYFVNPVTGACFAGIEAVNGLLDMQSRSLAVPSDEALKTLQAAVVGPV